MKKRRIRWSAILAGAVTVVGVLSHPEVLAMLPERAALAVTVAGAIVQALTKPLVRREGER